MLRRIRSGARGPSYGALGILSAAVEAASCGRPTFPQELFTIEAESAECPVMLSRVPNTAEKGTGKGRLLHAESGTSISVYQTGRTSTTLTHASRSEMPASSKLQAEIKRRDRWVSVDDASFYAQDFSALGTPEQSRQMTIDARAYR